MTKIYNTVTVHVQSSVVTNISVNRAGQAENKELPDINRATVHLQLIACIALE